MDNLFSYGLYNCSTIILRRDITILLMLNRSELLNILQNALDSSTEREVLRDAFLDCFFNYQERPFDLSWWQKLFWSLIFAAMLLVATGGNVIVIWIVLAHQRMRTVTNYFLVNLSVADLMMSLLNCVFNFIFLLNSDWPFGVVYCTINNFVAHVTVSSSVLTLVTISFDRYSNDKTRISCYLVWPDGTYLHSRIEYFYNIVFLSVTYLVPMALMAICYTLMGRKLWGSKSIGELTYYQKKSIKSKRKVVKMFIIVVVIFAICWLPYQGFFIFVYHHRHLAENSNIQHVYLSFYWLAMSNAMVNPIIYYWMNNRFRLYFQLIICKRTYCDDSPMHDFVKRTDVIPYNSSRLKSTSIRWKHNMPKTQMQNIRMRSTCINDHKQDTTTV
ncbi:tachykinin-like peptides receptor 86C isoform X2 [Bombus pascuorum]|uniref:tachykinin-like peptides receptor 86C isoform X2 n=1 Tax=Bombus pascuorum TaxID=65598 RepID=UPI00298ECF12|nr:tachykinin-like peptides receptor 86C isoform X2 [Bombus pascuorum]